MAQKQKCPQYTSAGILLGCSCSSSGRSGATRGKQTTRPKAFFLGGGLLIMDHYDLINGLQMAPNVSKWLQKTPKGSKWLQMVPSISVWHLMAQNGFKWLLMARNMSKQVQIVIQTTDSTFWFLIFKECTENAHHLKVILKA